MKQKLKNALTAALLAALALLPPLGANADSLDFRYRPVLAGKALLTEPGFVVRRELGVASLAPEMRIPMELVCRSSNETSGAFGFAWRCPQLESAVKWSAGSLLWTTPWGEECDDLTRSHGGTETVRSVPMNRMRPLGNCLRPRGMSSGQSACRRISRNRSRKERSHLRASVAPCEKNLLADGDCSYLALLQS